MAFVYCIGSRLLDYYTLGSDAARDQSPFPVSYVSLSRGGLCLHHLARLLLIKGVGMTIFDNADRTHRSTERWASVGIILGALFLGTIVFWRAERHPRTDDAEVFANLIGIAPQVEGPIVELKVRDNQFVRKGDLLY